MVDFCYTLNSTAVLYFPFFFSCACTCLNTEFLHITSSNGSWWVLSLANQLNCKTPAYLHANRVQKLWLGSQYYRVMNIPEFTVTVAKILKSVLFNSDL